MKYTLSIVLLMLVSGCTIRFTTKVADMQRTLDRFHLQTSKLVRSVDAARKQRQRLLSDIKAQGANLGQPPYPELRKSLRAAANVRRAIQIKHRELQQLRKRFARISRGKRRLYSDRPEWAKAKKIRGRLKPLQRELQTLVDQAMASFKSFDRTARQAKLGTLDVTQIVTQAHRQIKSLKQQLQASRSLVDGARTRLQSSAGLSPAGLSARRAALQDMSTAHQHIEKLVRQLTQAADRFEKLRAGRKKMVVGPGLLAHELLPRMKRAAAQIKIEIGQLKAAAARFNRSPK